MHCVIFKLSIVSMEIRNECPRKVKGYANITQMIKWKLSSEWNSY